MGLFGPSKKPHISVREMKEAKSRLYGKGLNDKDLRFLEVVFRADLFEERDLDKGISEIELHSALSWLREHPNHHNYSDKDLETIETVLRDYI